jgi:hypothetical protein
MRNFLIINSFLFIGCESTRFPVDSLYYVNQVDDICEEWTINTNDVTFSFNRMLPYTECAAVFGFKAKEIGKVTQWARDMKVKAQECR